MKPLNYFLLIPIILSATYAVCIALLHFSAPSRLDLFVPSKECTVHVRGMEDIDKELFCEQEKLESRILKSKYKVQSRALNGSYLEEIKIKAQKNLPNVKCDRIFLRRFIKLRLGEGNNKNLFLLNCFVGDRQNRILLSADGKSILVGDASVDERDNLLFIGNNSYVFPPAKSGLEIYEASDGAAYYFVPSCRPTSYDVRGFTRVTCVHNLRSNCKSPGSGVDVTAPDFVSFDGVIKKNGNSYILLATRWLDTGKNDFNTDLNPVYTAKFSLDPPRVFTSCGSASHNSEIDGL